MMTSKIGYMPMPTNFRHRSLFLHGRPRHEKYDDFWRRHPPMDIVHRAKIFSAFDALAGFGDCIAGKEVLYCERNDLSDEEREILNRKLAVLRSLTRDSKAARKNRPQISVRYFSPCSDEHSFAYGSGGVYKTADGICRKIDDVSGSMIVGDQVISLEDVADIAGEPGLFSEVV